MATAAAVTDDLLVEIQRIEELNDFREKFAQLRSYGREALRHYVKALRKSSGGEAVRWQSPPLLRHHALVIKALCRRGEDFESFKPLIEEIRKETLTTILDAPEKSPLFHDRDTDGKRLKFLDAAYALDALASAPDAVFSPATMYLYYVVVRELYYPAPPLWIVGGARAGEGGRPTAFVTSQFVRAILSFARMLERTSQYLGALAEMQQTAVIDLEAWDRMDAQRRALSLYTTLAQRSWNLAITMEKSVPATLDGKKIPKFEAAARANLIQAMAQAVATFQEAENEVRAYRSAENKAAARVAMKEHLIDRSEGAHAVAFRALSDAVKRAKNAKRVLGKAGAKGTKPLSPAERRRFGKQLRELEEQFLQTAEAVRKLVRPALDYLSAVLDAQLAIAVEDAGGAAFEPMEMAAAAATLGSAGQEWADERLLRAARLLGAAMGRDGFAISQPFHTAGGTSYYQPSQQHIVAAYAQILEHVDADLSPSVLTRILRYFEKTRQVIDSERSAWRWVHAEAKSPYSAYQTAIATIALDRLCRMLDRRINRLVLRHFTEKKPSLRLQDLFYPDYGLATLLEKKKSGRVPVAIALERMRAHILGVPLKSYPDRLYSAVFHGPPGTGKTTLMEALAASAGVPLIEVTPSDIVVRGTDQVEARAKAVLRALSFVTDAVIIFDEFDSVLQIREQEGGPQSIFAFLTPSMLPKLKTLYDAAKDRRVAFALATNFVGRLDPAAIRGGRFDAIIGVYPPDALSRYGRLFVEVQRYVDATGAEPPPAARFETVLAATRGAAMQHVGKAGWFSRPKEKVRSNTLFGFLFLDGQELPAFPTLTDFRFWSPEELEQWKLIESLERESETALAQQIWSRAARPKFARRG